MSTNVARSQSLEYGWWESAALILAGLALLLVILPFVLLPFVNVYAVPLAFFASLCGLAGIGAGCCGGRVNLIRRGTVAAICLAVLGLAHLFASNWPAGNRGVVPEVLWPILGLREGPGPGNNSAPKEGADKPE